MTKVEPVDTGPLHHGSHVGLLTRVETPPNTAPISAIIVPTMRTIDTLSELLRLGQEFRCPVLVLCTQSADPRLLASVGWRAGVDMISIDLGRAKVTSWPAFRTTALLDDRPFRSRAEAGLKRNLGLLLARLAGWERVLFLDDDITGVQSGDVRRAAALLDEYSIVGLDIGGFPDNSVVCHAYRAVGGAQDTFIGGGAMLVEPKRTASFFPRIYNEDWLFMLGGPTPRRWAVTGRVLQKRYDPFISPARARTEEFGDCIAEGLFWLLDNGGDVKDADVAFWDDFLARRQAFITRILARLEQLDPAPPHQDRIAVSVDEALRVNREITAEHCTAFLDAWHEDLELWRRYVETFADDSFGKGLARFGLGAHTYRSAEAELYDVELAGSLRGADGGRYATSAVSGAGRRPPR